LEVGERGPIGDERGKGLKEGGWKNSVKETRRLRGEEVGDINRQTLENLRGRGESAKKECRGGRK